MKDTVAKANGWTVGDNVPMEFPRTGVEQVPVKAIYKDNSLNGDFLLGLTTYERAFADQADLEILVKAAPGVAPAESRAAVDRVMADFPNVTVRDQAEFRDEQARQIDQIINLFYSLLGLAILIALFGIVNTLGLSIFERIRELGLLRAVGATRRQLRSMIRWEAVIIAVLGAVLGLAVGMFFGWTIVRALASQGITEFALPGGQLVGFVVAAAIAGILAAVLPGAPGGQDRRAQGDHHGVAFGVCDPTTPGRRWPRPTSTPTRWFSSGAGSSRPPRPACSNRPP